MVTLKRLVQKISVVIFMVTSIIVSVMMLVTTIKVMSSLIFVKTPFMIPAFTVV